MNIPPPIPHAPLGQTGVSLPPIVFGSSCLGNLYARIPDETKAAIVNQWFAQVPVPVSIDSAGKYGAGMALEQIGTKLRNLAVRPEDVVISNKLGWFRTPLRGSEPTFEKGVWEGLTHDAEQRISRMGILECWEQGCELLKGYVPSMVSVHDPDEYLAAASSDLTRASRREDILGAYDSLFSLKKGGHTKAVGIGSKDWKVIRDLSRDIQFDWVMLACSFTIMKHPRELLDFIAELHAKGVFIINSAVFHAGFLTGGRFFDYRAVSADNPEDKALFTCREGFEKVCRRHGVAPALACVQFGLSAPGVRAVSLNTGNPGRIAENVALATTAVPQAFWDELREQGLIDRDYPYLR